MMDVLEHIEDDSKFMEMVSDKLAINGILIITVPAFQKLFSFHNSYLLHFRRYKYETLLDILLRNKFEVLSSHYFYTSLYFVRWLQLKFDKFNPHCRDEGIGM